MAGETPITVIGNLTADPELRFTPNGVPVANFTVASTPRTFDRQTNEWRDGEAMFLNCSVWRQFAENVAESLSKGMRVIVNGNLKARSYEDRDGNRRTSYEIDVNEVGPSLRFASAKVARNQSSGGGNWGGNASAYGGGGAVCCARIEGDPLEVQWIKSLTQAQYEAGVREETITREIPSPPRTRQDRYLHVHFFPGDQVRVAWSANLDSPYEDLKEAPDKEVQAP